MTMKKRFLGLAMAAAMVVPATTVHALGNQTYSGNGDILRVPMPVSGSVLTKQGQTESGKIEVELPTSLNFMVTESGKFEGTRFNITNRSQSGINVFVEDFKAGSSNIKVTTKDAIEADAKKSNEQKTLDRSNVYLELTGDKTVQLTENVNTSSERDRNVVNVDAGASKLMVLNGGAGQKSNDALDTKGASGDFTLLFKIKKQA